MNILFNPITYYYSGITKEIQVPGRLEVFYINILKAFSYPFSLFDALRLPRRFGNFFLHLFFCRSMIVSQENRKGVQTDASFFTSGWIQPDKRA